MADPTFRLSDKAMAVFAFALYHQFTSGEAVADVVLDDGAGHKADPEAISELTEAGLLTVEGQRGAFTETGTALLSRTAEALRGAGR